LFQVLFDHLNDRVSLSMMDIAARGFLFQGNQVAPGY